MKVWFVLEANNIDTDVWISPPFYSEEEAKKYLFQRYEENVLEIGEDVVESVHHNDDTYSILTFGDDYFYGVIRSVDIKETSK